MASRPLRWYLTFTLAPILLCCQEVRDGGPLSTTTDSAGVEIVTLTGPGQELPWEVVEEWRVGGAGDGASPFSFLHGSLVESDSLGRIYVLDSQGPRVDVFHGDGKFLGTIGREGEGPGEFQRPANISVAPDGSLAVWDHRKRGLVQFDSEWDYVGLLQPEIRYQGPSLEASRGALMYTEPSRGEDGGILMSLVRFDGDTSTVMASVAQPPSPPVPVPGCPVQLPMPPIFFPSLVWDLESELTGVAASREFEIDLFQGERLIRKIRWDRPPREVTRELAIQELGDGFTIGLSSGPCTAPAAEMVDAQGYEEFLPAIHAIKLSPGGEIWAERGLVRGEPRIIDVFRDGRYLGTLPSNFPFPAAFPDQDRILTVEHDGFDVPFLVSYRILR